MSTETELKLRIAPDKLRRFRRHPLLRELRLAAARTRTLRNVYFDTEDLVLREHGMALRVRHVGNRRIQTLKAPAGDASGAAHRYLEREAPIAGDRPDLALVGDEDLPVTRSDELKEIFVSEIRRSTVPLMLGDSHIELAVDTGDIVAANGRASVCEAELELKSGNPARLHELALALLDRVPFTLEHRTKSARGYDLLLGAQPKPERAASVALDPAMTAWQGFAAIARQCLAHLRANEDCARLGDDPEGVHQLRVGLRRLRAAFSLFKATLPQAEAARFAAELRWAQQQLGPARDWDVFIDNTLTPLSTRPSLNESLRALTIAAEEARTEAYRRVAATLDEPRYTRLQLELDLWLETEAEQAADGAPAPWTQPIGEVAGAVLTACHRKARKLAKRFAELDDDDRHKLRIRAKKARYAAEFFRSIYPRKAARRYAKALAAMQDCLGSINDAVVGHRLVGGLAAADAALGRSDQLLAGWYAARIVGDLPRGRQISRKVAKADRFWDER